MSSNLDERCWSPSKVFLSKIRDLEGKLKISVMEWMECDKLRKCLERWKKKESESKREKGDTQKQKQMPCCILLQAMKITTLKPPPYSQVSALYPQLSDLKLDSHFKACHPLSPAPRRPVSATAS